MSGILLALWVICAHQGYYDVVVLLLSLLILLVLPIFLVSAETIMYRTLLMVISLISIVILLAQDILTFFIAYELLLIPLIYLFLAYSTHNLKRRALTLLIMFTLAGSITLLLCILYLATILTPNVSYNYLSMQGVPFNLEESIMLNVGFFLAFAVKVPTYPLHLWLPAAHVEAPKLLSIYLAAILLKLGYYGLYRFNYLIFYEGLQWLYPLINVLALLSSIYATIIAYGLTDIKKIIAYSSVAHMNLGLLALIASGTTSTNIYAGLLYTVAHGIVSSGLFYNVGILYDRHHTRSLPYYRGLTLIYPLLMTFFGILLFSNIGFPLTAGFPCELLIFLQVFTSDALHNLMIFIVLVLGAVYNIILLHRIGFGKLSRHILIYNDVTRKDVHINLYLILISTYLGTIGVGLISHLI